LLNDTTVGIDLQKNLVQHRSGVFQASTLSRGTVAGQSGRRGAGEFLAEEMAGRLASFDEPGESFFPGAGALGLERLHVGPGEAGSEIESGPDKSPSHPSKFF
jgi:hypothetical protein